MDLATACSTRRTWLLMSRPIHRAPIHSSTRAALPQGVPVQLLPLPPLQERLQHQQPRHLPLLPAAIVERKAMISTSRLDTFTAALQQTPTTMPALLCARPRQSVPASHTDPIRVFCTPARLQTTSEQMLPALLRFMTPSASPALQLHLLRL